VLAFVTVEKRKQLRHIVTEMQRTADSLITQAIDLLDDKYPAQPPAGAKAARRRGRGPN
jgi:hypothetical protein